MSNEYTPVPYQDPGFEQARRESRELNTSIFDSRIAEGLNRSAGAGAVQGSGNPSNLSARAYAIMSGQKAAQIANEASRIRSQELGYKAQHNLMNTQGEIQHNLQKPNFFNFLETGLNVGSSLVPVAGGLGLFGKTFQDNYKGQQNISDFSFPLNFTVRNGQGQSQSTVELGQRGIEIPGLSFGNPNQKSTLMSGGTFKVDPRIGGNSTNFNIIEKPLFQWK